MTEQALIPPSWQALYAPWAPASRRSYGWATPFILILTYAISAIPLVILMAVAAAGAPGGLEAVTEQGEAAVSGDVLLPGILMQFALWAALIIVWAKAFERRSFASMGFTANRWLARYLRGLAIGVGLVVLLGGVMAALTAIAPGAVPEEMRDMTGPDDADWAVLAGGAFIGFALFAIITFLIQGGAEEVIFRGWLMSTLTARWGAVAAIIGSSVIFGAFHLHVMVSGVAYGLMAVFGIAATGLFFALYAYAERGVWGAAAAHGTFNAAATLMPLAMMQVSEPDRTPGDLFAEVLERATGMAGVEATEVGPHLLVQPAVFLILSLIVFLRLRARKA
ncbi:CPBP family intramembrane glutamic endopeptidase [Glycocaulis sp.]|uniref:CPBP family intramembrane glutamic endopeptidase n=1 Tax=Glycocaulis sp. TaxID=1969725 RepID=UPI003D19C998